MVSELMNVFDVVMLCLFCADRFIQLNVSLQDYEVPNAKITTEHVFNIIFSSIINVNSMERWLSNPNISF